MLNEFDLLLTLGVGTAGIILYYIVFFTTWVKEGRPVMLWIHIVNQALLGGFLGGTAAIVCGLLKG